MEHTSEQEEDDLLDDSQISTLIEESQEPQPHGGSLQRTKKIDQAALSVYGESFVGYQKIEEVRDLIPAFKEFYYEEVIKNPKAKIGEMLREFNESINPRKFHPYMTNIRAWRIKWDADILEKKNMAVADITTEKAVQQVLKTRNDDRSLIAPEDSSLEAGVRTLGGELLNDAFQMLREDQQNPEIYDDEVLVKRRNYIVGVFGHVTKLVHGKAALLLKASEEKRNNAGFLMELLAKATSGKLSDSDMEMLKSNYANAPVESGVPQI